LKWRRSVSVAIFRTMSPWTMTLNLTYVLCLLYAIHEYFLGICRVQTFSSVWGVASRHRALVHAARNPTAVSLSSGWYSGLRAHVTSCASHGTEGSDSLFAIICSSAMAATTEPNITNKPSAFPVASETNTKWRACYCLFVFVLAGMPAPANKGSCPNHRNPC
jgi:hypothetical protein